MFSYRAIVAVAFLAVFQIRAAVPALAQEQWDNELQLIPEKGALSSVKVALFDTNKGKLRPNSYAVTDMWLRMFIAKGDIKVALKRSNAPSIDRNEKLFTIELLSIVMGKLHSDSKGYCSGWSNDMAWCTYGCDGQGFQLKRVSTEYPIRMRILLAGKFPTQNAPEGMLSARTISLCGADANGDELLVVPQKGETAEIKLSNE